MKPAKIEKLLDEKWLKKYLRKTVRRIFPKAKKILEIKIKPIKIYRDRRSFNLSALYKIKMQDSNGKICQKIIFAAADSHNGKEKDWLTGRRIYNYLSKKPGRVLRLPQPYAFFKQKGLFLREYIKGTVLAKAIKKNRILTPKTARNLAQALQEFQNIQIPARQLKKIKPLPNWRDLEKNIRILKNRKHSQLATVKKEFKKIKTALRGIAEFENRQPKVLSHGDLNPLNIILTPTGKIVFLDTGNARVRHPLFDAAGFCAHLETLSDLKIGKKARRKSQRLFLKAYFEGKKLKPKEKALFALYEKYFHLLTLTHVLVWGKK